METIVINDKIFVVKECHKLCSDCLFNHNNNYPNKERFCISTKCYNFIVIREANVIDRIRMWFKKKIKK